jgi:hypothetical protein
MFLFIEEREQYWFKAPALPYLLHIYFIIANRERKSLFREKYVSGYSVEWKRFVNTKGP